MMKETGKDSYSLSTKWTSLDMRRPGGCKITELQTMYKEGQLQPQKILEEGFMDAYAFEDKFSEEELEAYKEGFKFFDKRNDGTIDNENLPLAFRSMGLLVSGDEIKAFLKRFDPDNNGSIDQNDYLTAIAELSNKSDTEEDIRNAFALFDKNENGLISKKVKRNLSSLDIEEFTHVLTRLGDALTEEEVSSILGVLDIYEDGYIRIEDIVKHFKVNSPHNNLAEELDENLMGHSHYQFSTNYP